MSAFSAFFSRRPFLKLLRGLLVALALGALAVSAAQAASAKRAGGKTAVVKNHSAQSSKNKPQQALTKKKGKAVAASPQTGARSGARSGKAKARASKAAPRGAQAAQSQGRPLSAKEVRLARKRGQIASGQVRQVRQRGKLVYVSVRRSPVVVAPVRLSYGQLAGLHATPDELDLKSSVALVVDLSTREVLLSKNEQAVLPIASLTKLMTGLVVSESGLPLDERIAITAEDVDTEKGSHSRLHVGATLTRGELLHLALMSSENRAAHALGRTWPAGMAEFVALMNARAQSLGMTGTRYVEPTGLSSRNQSTAQDLALLAAAAAQDPLMRELSTSPGRSIDTGDRVLQFNTTNALVKKPDWQIGLQKTGYIAEAGRCLVMQAQVAGRSLIMVFLDSSGKYSRLSDAERVRRWVESGGAAAAEATHQSQQAMPPERSPASPAAAG